MSMGEVTDAMLGKIAKIAYGGVMALMMFVLTFAANSIKDEFKDVNDHLSRQDSKLDHHGASLAVIENTDTAFLQSLRDSNASVTLLAATIAKQAELSSALRQRMDDNDEFLKEISPMGVDGGRSHLTRPR